MASGFWGKAEVAFEDGNSQVCPGPQPWMNVFVSLFLTSSHPAPTILVILPLLPHKITRAWSCPHWGPCCTNDPTNYVFKVFGSCENSFGLAVEGWEGGPWGGPWSHGYHYCPAFYVNTGLGQRRLIEERGGGGCGGIWHRGRKAGCLRFGSLVSPLGGSPSETSFSSTHTSHLKQVMVC